MRDRSARHAVAHCVPYVHPAMALKFPSCGAELRIALGFKPTSREVIGE